MKTLENKSETFIGEFDIPAFTLPKVVKYGLFKEYYGEVTSIEVYNTLEGYVVQTCGFYNGLFGRTEFSKLSEDCFVGGDPYIRYFSTEEAACGRQQEIMRRTYEIF